MTNFLFWNVCGIASNVGRGTKSKVRPLLPTEGRYLRLQTALEEMIRIYTIDVVVLAESPFGGSLGITGFTEAKTTLKANQKTKTRLEIYHNATVSFVLQDVVERAVIQEMTVAASSKSILVVSAHLASPPRPEIKTREKKVEFLASDIRAREDKIGYVRSVLIGDLNFDPHDDIVTSFHGLNAVPSKCVANQTPRTDGRSTAFPYFYNPMWAHLCDVTGPVPGSYYRKTSEIDCRFWYIPDQVMIRPALISCWQDNDLRILSAAGKISLLDQNGLPDSEQYSDHLPIVFTLDLR